MDDIFIKGIGFNLQGIDSLNQLVDLEKSCQNHDFFSPELKIEKRGLRYKNLSTKLAISVANDTLLNSKIIKAKNEKINSSDLAIIVCSTLGNIDTIGKVMDTINRFNSNETSPLDLPNLSCNIIASSLAIWFNLTGINLTVCNGATSTIDALHLGANIIRQNRAKQALIIGVEVLNNYTDKITGIITTQTHPTIGAIGLLLDSTRNCKNNHDVSFCLNNSNSDKLLNDDDIIRIISNLNSDLIILPCELYKAIEEKEHHTKSSFISLDSIYGDLDGLSGLLSCLYGLSMVDRYNQITILIGNPIEKYKSITLKKDKMKEEIYTIQLRPKIEGANVENYMGFKHLTYLMEEAIHQFFRDNLISANRLYFEFGSIFLIKFLKIEILKAVNIDDLLNITITNIDKDRNLTYKIKATSNEDPSITFFRGEIKLQITPPTKNSDLLDQNIIAINNKYEPLSIYKNIEVVDDPIATLKSKNEYSNSYILKKRIPYFYCNYTRLLQHSGYERIIEEVVDLFLEDRNISIKKMLDTRQWIPVVSKSQIEIMNHVNLEDYLYITYTVSNILIDSIYEAELDFFICVESKLVQVAKASITHGYTSLKNSEKPELVKFDQETLNALKNEKK